MARNDVIWVYGVHNRLYYNSITFPNVMWECQRSDRIGHLLVVDDMSTDGTSEFIQSLDAGRKMDGNYTYIRQKVGNSTAQWNMAYELAEKLGGKNYIFNICNDNLFPNGIVDELAEILDNRRRGFAVGTLMNNAKCQSKEVDTYYPYILKNKEIVTNGHIGCGLLRISDYKRLGKITPSTIEKEKRYFGFTDWQNKMRAKFEKEALIAKHVKMLRLDVHPAFSRLKKYTDLGWGRNIRGKQESLIDD